MVSVHLLALALALAACLTPGCRGFGLGQEILPAENRGLSRPVTTLLAAGRGFGKPSGARGAPAPAPIPAAAEKTYGRSSRAIPDLIDDEAAMDAFFSGNPTYHPLFRALAASAGAAAVAFLGGGGGEVGGDVPAGGGDLPWRVLDAPPTGDEAKIAVLAAFLDSVQQSLIDDIPVDEAGGDGDEYDVQFIEEGRRMLMIGRFQVLDGLGPGLGGRASEELLSACWSEVAELRRADAAGTGSVLLLPGLDTLADLRRFVDMNLQRPLEWLGLGDVLEVASLQKGENLAVRILHRIEDIPDIPEENDNPTAMGDE